MKLIVATAEASNERRAAILTALRWGASAGARVTVLTVCAPAPVAAERAARSLAPAGHAEPWLPPEPQSAPTWTRPGSAVVVGVPSVEIARFAEEAGAGLLVVGCEGRSALRHRAAGDVADAIARRSHVPCLFVSTPLEVPRKLVVALPPTKQGYRVYRAARQVAHAVGAELDLVTVEPGRPDESTELAAAVPSAGTMNLQQMLGTNAPAIRIRRGPVVPELLAEVEASRAQVLVIGYHRGGQPTHRRVGSIARTLAGLAPCAVLTIPL